MFISSIKIKNLRALRNITIKPSASINYIYGKNGAGKTTILESIFLMTRNRGLSNNQKSNLISLNEKQLSIDISIKYSTGSILHTNLKKNTSNTSIFINGQRQKNITTIAKTIPLGIVTPNTHKIIFEGPKYRRRLIDWGVFHVEQNYASMIKKYNKVLRYRNRALQLHDKHSYIWDSQLVDLAMAITKKRKDFLDGVIDCFADYSNQFFDNSNISFEYRNGWNDTKTLQEELFNHLAIDEKRGFTSVGPHRANLVVKYDGHEVKDFLSRGQIKLLIILFILAKLTHITATSDESPILLMDDIFSELDENNRLKLINILIMKKFQTFLTNTDSMNFMSKLKDCKMFHVEQGDIV